MTVHRFFLPAECFDAGNVLFTPAAAHQIRRVLRLRTGDTVITLDGSGMEYITRLEQVGALVSGDIVHARWNEAEPETRLTLYLGLLKATKLETVLQRCAEIGVSRFVPVQTARSVAREPGSGRRERFEAILRESAELCGRGRIPSIGETLSLDQAIAEAIAAGPAVMLWEEEHETLLREVSSSERSIFVGPEGGFEAGEAGRAAAAGITLATLGRRVLRAETAAIAASAMLLLPHEARAQRVDSSMKLPV